MAFPSRPVCVDLFAGAGGMSLGFEQAGFDVACAVEIDPVHCAVHKYNFPSSAVICADVEELTAEEIRSRGGIGKRKVTAVVGGSPCQGFSMIGKRSLDDPRNALVGHFMRLVAELDADYFVLENVKGLTIGKHKTFLDEVVEGFRAADYEIQLPWKVLNAANFGVPQHRERLFLIGAKKGLRLPAYPDPVFNAPKARKPISGLPAGPTVADALGDLPDAGRFPELFGTDTVKAEYGKPSAYASVLRGLADDPEDFSAPRPIPAGVLSSSARAAHNETTVRRFSETEPGKVEPVSRFLRLDPEGVCNTLRAGTGRERGAFTAARPIHPFYPRCITVREMARLHSYPDWFRFNWTKWHGAREVGNSVPPLLARAVARSIMAASGRMPSKPSNMVTPGPEFLLRMDSTDALAYFDGNQSFNNVDSLRRAS